MLNNDQMQNQDLMAPLVVLLILVVSVAGCMEPSGIDGPDHVDDTGSPVEDELSLVHLRENVTVGTAYRVTAATEFGNDAVRYVDHAPNATLKGVSALLEWADPTAGPPVSVRVWNSTGTVASGASPLAVELGSENPTYFRIAAESDAGVAFHDDLRVTVLFEATYFSRPASPPEIRD